MSLSMQQTITCRWTPMPLMLFRTPQYLNIKVICIYFRLGIALAIQWMQISKGNSAMKGVKNQFCLNVDFRFKNCFWSLQYFKSDHWIFRWCTYKEDDLYWHVQGCEFNLMFLCHNFKQEDEYFNGVHIKYYEILSIMTRPMFEGYDLVKANSNKNDIYV